MAGRPPRLTRPDTRFPYPTFFRSMTLWAAPDWLRAEGWTLAWCWRLARRDGVVIGFTSHDRDLVIGGLAYRAAPGMKPSAIETNDSLDAATMDLEGAIASDAIDRKSTRLNSSH